MTVFTEVPVNLSDFCFLFFVLFDNFDILDETTLNCLLNLGTSPVASSYLFLSYSLPIPHITYPRTPTYYLQLLPKCYLFIPLPILDSAIKAMDFGNLDL